MYYTDEKLQKWLHWNYDIQSAQNGIQEVSGLFARADGMDRETFVQCIVWSGLLDERDCDMVNVVVYKLLYCWFGNEVYSYFVGFAV